MSATETAASVRRRLAFLRQPLLRPLLLAGAVGVILAVGAIVRTVSLTENPVGFFCDEASFGYNAYKILKTGEDEFGVRMPVFFRAFGEYKLGLFVYSEVPLIALLGLTELTVRLTTALYGTLSILAVFFLGWTLFRRPGVGLAAAFFLAIIPWHVHYSRIGFEIVTFPFFLAVGLSLFLMGARNPRWWPAAALVLGITLYSYRAAWAILPPLVVLLVILYRKELWQQRTWTAFSLWIFMLVAIPMILHLAGGEDRAQDVNIFNQDLSARETAETFVEHYRTYFTRSFLFDRADDGAITRHYLPGYGNLYYIQLPFLLLGLLGLLWPLRREKAIVLALLLLYPVPGAITVDSPISSRAIAGSLVFALVTGYGVFVAVDGLSKIKWRTRASPRPIGAALAAVLVAAVAAIALNNFASYLQRYHDEYPKLSAGFWGWQYGAQEVIEYFETVQDDYDQFVLEPAFNAPDIFYHFYTLDRCLPPRCVIGTTDRYNPQLRQLFALRPESQTPDYFYVVHDQIMYPYGEVAFDLVEVRDRSSFPEAAPPPTLSR
ncbi:MAG: glycosyltransferase family 39 protein [Dehalococcoidia bacterium]|nr:glycosyltransferase family 39 protein [Dehalococcoidia bacterium]